MLVELGFAPSRGREGMNECQDFKAALWRKLQKRNGEGWFLKTIHRGDNEQYSGIAIEYDIGVPLAVEFKDRVVALADTVWHEVICARRAGIHIIDARRP